MRWDNLRAAPGDSGAPGDTGAPGDSGAPEELPLALHEAVVRTFDTPDFRGMTFYEVQAKSVINRVAGGSRVPFEWTLNPYRGCTHACSYCMSGDTPILMADGRTRPLADLQVGDAICGTVRRGAYRRYTVTQVLAHWSTVKPAYRIMLQDGTQLIASGDHRFLSMRGWRRVAGAEPGRGRGPRLGTGDVLLGVGEFAAQPKDSVDYRQGYLRGVVRDGPVGGPGQGDLDGDRFRLAWTDAEAVERADRYLADFGVASIGAVPAELIRWPARASLEWCQGFLAGAFDADGSYLRGALRIAHTDQQLTDRIVSSLQLFGFNVELEGAHRSGEVTHVRIRGGLRGHLRFFHTVDPAITHKRTITGAVVRTSAQLGVASIRPLGIELPLFDITTGTGDFVADGVVSHNCFARNTHTYLDLDAGRDFDTRVVVKVNAGELLRHELAAPRWRGGHIAMGTNVDCYQRAEGRYRLMREILTALRDFANPFSILTKGTLILRDLDLLTQAAQVAPVGVALSVGFVDETLWRSVEPGTPSPRRRLDAVRQLADAGFAVGVLMAPILPGLTDTAESIEDTVAAIAAAGAASITPLPLHLRPGAREWYLRWLAGTHPELLPRYQELYGERSYLGSGYQREVTARVRLAARRHGLGSGTAGDARRVPTSPEESRALGVGAILRAPERPPPEQLTLL